MAFFLQITLYLHCHLLVPATITSILGDCNSLIIFLFLFLLTFQSFSQSNLKICRLDNVTPSFKILQSFHLTENEIENFFCSPAAPYNLIFLLPSHDILLLAHTTQLTNSVSVLGLCTAVPSVPLPGIFFSQLFVWLAAS